MRNLKILKLKYLLPIVILGSFSASFIIPGAGENQTIRAILTSSGILYAILIGFFITDLYTRFDKIRTNVAVEVSGLITYFSFVKVLGKSDHHKAWAEKQRELIDAYVKKFVTVEWHEYEKTDSEFNKILDSLTNIGELKTIKEQETYTNLLPVLSRVAGAREKLIIVGKDRLTKTEWLVVLFLAATLIFNLFYLKEPTLASIIFTGSLTSAVLILTLVLEDLSDLSFGEEIVSVEPYQKIFDAIGKPRFYLKSYIQRGRVHLPEGKEYRTD